MKINLQTLQCGECGSHALRRTGLNQYLCEHCGSTSVVEDNVSERLDRVLDQVKDAAASRLAAEHSLRQKRAMRITAFALAGLFGTVALVIFISSFMDNSRTQPNRSLAAVKELVISTDGLKLESRQVLVGSGSSARPKLLVVARNETGYMLERTSIDAVFYAGDNKFRSDSEYLPSGVLAPGESAAVLMSLPDGEAQVTRQSLTVDKLSVPRGLVSGPRLQLERARLVQEGDTVRLVGRVLNTRQDVALAGIQTIATLYDNRGSVIGFGTGYTPAAELKPGERSVVDMRIARFGGAADIASWDYRIDYSVKPLDSAVRQPAASADRSIKTTGAPEQLNPDFRMGTEDLLADASELFDTAQLELLPLVTGFDNIRRRTYMTELVNRSTDTIAISPALVIARYDGNTLDGKSKSGDWAYLYPGERLPIQVDPSRADRITQTRVEWKPSRRAPLPGPRIALDIKVDSTRAVVGSVLVNFSQRFSYKAVEVKGTVKNTSDRMVRKARVWVSLRDREDKITGFKLLDSLPAMAPGDSLPFEVRIDQQGRDFASVNTAYQTTD